MLIFAIWGVALWLRLARQHQEQLNVSRHLEEAVRDLWPGSNHGGRPYLATTEVPGATGRVLALQDEEIRRFRRDFRRPVSLG